MLLDTVSQEMRFETRILPLRMTQQIIHTTTMGVQDTLQLWNNMLTENGLNISLRKPEHLSTWGTYE